MFREWVSIRRTNKYVGTYAHMDSWDDLGIFKFVPGKVLSYGNGLDEGKTRLIYTRVPRGIPSKTVRKALIDTFNRHGCACEHDCCGCASYSARPFKVKGRVWGVKLYTSYNY